MIFIVRQNKILPNDRKHTFDNSFDQCHFYNSINDVCYLVMYDIVKKVLNALTINVLS